MAVIFQLVCLSRLGATQFISTLVLFLTLVVFTGPLLNTWLMVANYTCVKKSEWTVVSIIIVIMGAHFAGAGTASGIVTAFAQNEVNSTKSMLFWKTPQKVAELKDLGLDDWKVANHFFDELFGVTSLLIGCVYLLWLEQVRKEIHDRSTTPVAIVHEILATPDLSLPTPVSDVPQIQIVFYLQLTLLVAAVSQAFPSAHLSPHISAYLVFTQQIPPEVFVVRFIAGLLACSFTYVWSLLRTSYRTEIQKQQKQTFVYSNALSNEHEKAGLVHTKGQMPSFRLSMHSDSYF